MEASCNLEGLSVQVAEGFVNQRISITNDSEFERARVRGGKSATALFAQLDWAKGDSDEAQEHTRKLFEQVQSVQLVDPDVLVMTQSISGYSEEVADDLYSLIHNVYERLKPIKCMRVLAFERHREIWFIATFAR